MKISEVRHFALSLPESSEKPHFDKTSFRIGQKIFATIPPDGDVLHVFVDEDETRSCVAKIRPSSRSCGGEEGSWACVSLSSMQTPISCGNYSKTRGAERRRNTFDLGRG